MMEGGWISFVLTLCTFIAALLIWMEYRRANKRFFLLRIVAVIAAITAMACIVLPVKYTRTVAKDDEHKVVLLTQGFDPDSLPAGIDTEVYTADVAIKKLYPKVRLINGLDELSRVNQLHIYGNGLSKDELSQLGSLPVTFHAATFPAGITGISWRDMPKAGEALKVQGSYNNSSTKKVKLVLSGLNTRLDSVIMPPNAQTSFELSTIPKATGKIVFNIKADTTLQGDVPVQVQPVKLLKVLMLTASPDFETKFLKNWLSRNGYSVAIRSAISKGKYNSEYINTEQFSLDKLSAQTLARFDVVIGDLSVLSNLSTLETETLKQEMADKGLGLIVQGDSAGKTSWLQKQFPVDRLSDKEPLPASLTINGQKSVSNKLAYGTMQIIYQNGTQPLVTTNGHVLAGKSLYGSGNIIFTTLNSTFSWLLAGNKQDYIALWSTLLNKAARKRNEPRLEIEFSSLPVSDEPVLLQISQNSTSAVIINRLLVAPAQNPVVPFEWSANYQPSTAGWQSLKQGNIISNWFVYNNNNWQTLRSIEKISATHQYAILHHNKPFVTKQIHQIVKIDVPKIYFYILLLAACTFLWIETKLP